MRFIQKWSYCCATWLMNNLKENHEKRRVYYFGFQVVIGAIVKGVLLFSLAFLLNTILPSLLIVLVFGGLRMLAGGYHMNTYGKCITVSVGLFLAAGILAKYTYPYWNTLSLLVLVLITFVIAVIMIHIWAPRDTPNRPITDPAEQKKFKTLSYVYIIVWFILSISLIYFKQPIFVLSGSFGVLLEVFAISATGHRFFDRISGKMGTL